jgi:hypothetical protein
MVFHLFFVIIENNTILGIGSKNNFKLTKHSFTPYV